MAIGDMKAADSHYEKLRALEREKEAAEAAKLAAEEAARVAEQEAAAAKMQAAAAAAAPPPPAAAAAGDIQSGIAPPAMDQADPFGEGDGDVKKAD